jgi:hypothetical protein
MEFWVAIVVVLVVVLLVAVVRARRRADHPAGATQSPEELAAALEWREGEASPNRSRVLWTAPASAALRSMTQGGAAYFAAGCPVDLDDLAEKLPDDAVQRSMDWPLQQDQMVRLLLGFRPQVMEDKWVIASWPTEGGLKVFFLRSWTGALVYVLEVEKAHATRLWAPANDSLAEPMAQALLDGYVFQKPCVVPAPAELGEDKLKLMAWGIRWAGRHCDAVQPQWSRERQE